MKKKISVSEFLARVDSEIEDFKFVASSESDRGVVLAGSAFLERILEDLLKSKLVQIEGQDPLFSHANSPLGNFSGKIELAFRLGMISQKFQRDLNRIRRIRNRFAHDPAHCTFEDEAVVSQMTSLREDFPLLEGESIEASPRGQFEFITRWMMYWLNICAHEAKALEAHSDEFAYTHTKKSEEEILRDLVDMFESVKGRKMTRDDLTKFLDLREIPESLIQHIHDRGETD